jgi:UDP-3-O-[3-hydroxymyristoyl] N-acetylglucosamine deacetylase
MFQSQKTVKKKVSYSGVGIHTGEPVSLSFCPAPAHHGIVFRRVDLDPVQEIRADLEFVIDTARNTTLGSQGVKIHTVEHVLAAISAFGIDNLLIEITNIEPPVGDGSALVFTDLLEKAGVLELKETKEILSLKEVVFHSEGQATLVAIPSDSYKISYTLSYPESKLLGCQFYSSVITKELFQKEIAPCRTFSLYEEVSLLMEAGLIKGGSLDNAVVIKGDQVLNSLGLRFDNEMVRHKVLDVIGDMSLVGNSFNAHIIAIKSGHASNFAFAKKIKKVLEQGQKI